MSELNGTEKQFDPVERPSHYADGFIQPIEVIDDWELDFCLGNAVKYIKRAGHKKSGTLSDIDKEIEDLCKAKWYLEHKIERLLVKKDEEYEDE